MDYNFQSEALIMKSVAHIYSTFLLIILSFLCAVAPAQCADVDANIIFASPKEGWPPFIIPATKHNPVQGIMIDILRETTQSWNGSFTHVAFPEKRSQLLLKEGTIQVYPKAKEWVNKPEDFDWSDPVVTSSDVIIFKRTSAVSRIPLTLTRLDIGVIHGFSYPKLEPLFKAGKSRRHNAKSTESLMRMLKRNHIDAAVTNRHVAEWIIKNNKDLSVSDFMIREEPLDSAPYRFAFTKAVDCRPFIEKFNQELQAMKNDGRLEAIINKYR